MLHLNRTAAFVLIGVTMATGCHRQSEFEITMSKCAQMQEKMKAEAGSDPVAQAMTGGIASGICEGVKAACNTDPNGETCKKAIAIFRQADLH